MDSVILYACISLILGLVLTFFGLRFMKATVAVVGFLIGLGIVYALLANSGWDQLVITLVAIAGGILVASAAFWFYQTAITLSIAYFFGHLAYTIAHTASSNYTMALVVGIAVGVIGFFLLRAIDVVDKIFAFMTAFQGASAIVTGAYLFMYPSAFSAVQSNNYSITFATSAFWLVAWAALAITGFMYQVSSHRARTRNPS